MRGISNYLKSLQSGCIRTQMEIPQEVKEHQSAPVTFSAFFLYINAVKLRRP